MRWQRFKTDRGSAILEFIVVGILLNVGILVFSTQLMQIQRDQMVAESVARHATRLLSRGATEIEAQNLASQIAQQFGYGPDLISVRATCSSEGCNQIGDFVTLQVKANRATTTATMPVTVFTADPAPPEAVPSE